MEKLVLDLGNSDALHHLAKVIIERAFPESTDVTPEMFVNELKNKVEQIIGGRV